MNSIMRAVIDSSKFIKPIMHGVHSKTSSRLQRIFRRPCREHACSKAIFNNSSSPCGDPFSRGAPPGRGGERKGNCSRRDSSPWARAFDTFCPQKNGSCFFVPSQVIACYRVRRVTDKNESFTSHPGLLSTWGGGPIGRSGQTVDIGVVDNGTSLLRV